MPSSPAQVWFVSRKYLPGRGVAAGTAGKGIFLYCFTDWSNRNNIYWALFRVVCISGSFIKARNSPEWLCELQKKPCHSTAKSGSHVGPQRRAGGTHQGKDILHTLLPRGDEVNFQGEGRGYDMLRERPPLKVNLGTSSWSDMLFGPCLFWQPVYPTVTPQPLGKFNYSDDKGAQLWFTTSGLWQCVQWPHKTRFGENGVRIKSNKQMDYGYQWQDFCKNLLKAETFLQI